MRRRLNTFLQKALWIIAFVFCLLIFALNIYYHSSVSYDGFEVVTIAFDLVYSFIALLIIGLLVLFIRRFLIRLERINQNWLFFFFALINYSFYYT